MRSVSIVALLAVAVGAQAQAIVYDNTTTFGNRVQTLLSDLVVEGTELGDEVQLAGTAREVTELRLLFFYRGVDGGQFDARIRLLMDDGPGGTPGTQLYASPLVESLDANNGLNEYTFAIPNVTVPDTVIWTIDGFNPVNITDELGPAYFHPPTIGSSEDFFWRFDGQFEWTPYAWGGSPYANFGAQITAVPEPATLAALALGASFLLGRRRQR
jgi:hypothetical protein